ncbi:TetR/AcrR family transcriptional regulator C-terminal domain-containing protein [Saccharomonospora xinjiangensis]|uniref:TetR/AcrR family transcriptional regulator C-terminal domain-containing protein n=1 Tax=Saccharomonospora xinjiangensis TaxID=75294 RepID=UPI00350F6A49
MSDLDRRQGSSAEAAESLRELGNHHTYPHLFATPTDHLVNFDERFEFGLHVIVEGLKTTGQTTWASRP